MRGAITAGDITMEDIMGALPSNNTMDRVRMEGREVRRALENVVDEFCPDRSCHQSRFLVFSGLRVTYRIGLDNVGDRIEEISVRCTKKLDGDLCDR